MLCVLACEVDTVCDALHDCETVSVCVWDTEGADDPDVVWLDVDVTLRVCVSDADWVSVGLTD
jgi:hypothetical protein